MHFLRDGEKITGSLNHSPLCAQAKAVHKQRERGDRLGHAAAVVGELKFATRRPLSLSALSRSRCTTSAPTSAW
jgi:hypothetical protein